jgi:endo-1,4-beta-xylanase
MKRYFQSIGGALTGVAGIIISAGPMQAQSNTPSLKEVFQDSFLIGTAINRGQAGGGAAGNRNSERVERDVALVKAQFNQISPENDLKWESVHPRDGAEGYNFGPADAFVNFGLSNKMYLVGHTLAWHSQTPRWVFQDGTNGPAGKELVLQRLHDHINAVVGRYKGKIKVWDVVNEVLNDSSNAGDTNIYRAQSPWIRICGPEFIVKAFQWAHEADPDAVLRYNDYSIENPAKRARLIAMITWLQSQNVPVHAIGSQTHANLTWPSAQLEDEALTDIESLGLPIHITELDVNGAAGGQRNQSADVAANAGAAGGGVVSEADKKLADQYAVLFNAFLKHQKSVKMVTFWGVNDAVSWRSNGRPLLFDGNDQPKPAFFAVIKAKEEFKK